ATFLMSLCQIAMAEGTMFCPFVCLIPMNTISQEHLDEILKFGTNVHLENEFKVTVTSQNVFLAITPEFIH
ncbi:hypothetical protein P3436_25415, partial [Vibrio parahaemolyticus]|nr:hypothetical protein [Vibrio parahaemolyticus]